MTRVVIVVAPAVLENIKRGNDYNKVCRPNYTYNEVRVMVDGREYRVDSYEPPFIDSEGNYHRGQIVSRKHTDLDQIKSSTWYAYLTEAKTKYSEGAEIIDGPFNPKELRGGKLQGDLYLEVPDQDIIPNDIASKANDLGITIRPDSEEHLRAPQTSDINDEDKKRTDCKTE